MHLGIFFAWFRGIYDCIVVFLLTCGSCPTGFGWRWFILIGTALGYCGRSWRSCVNWNWEQRFLEGY